jgi:hypothetical protein
MNGTARSSTVVAHVALEFYIKDITTLVETSVLKEIKKGINHHDPTVHEQATRRRKDLAAWKKKKDPLSYSSLIDLCRVVVPGDTKLPESSDGRVVLKKFLEDLVDRGVRTTSINKNATPYIRDGAFQSVLPVAVECIKGIYRVTGTGSKAIIVEALRRAWHNLKINHVPGAPPRDSHAQGRPFTLAAFDCWTCFGAVNPETGRSINLRPEERLMDEMESNLRDAMEMDADGPWHAMEYKMKDFDKMLKRRTRPVDFQLIDLSAYPKDSYMVQTYHYVRDIFDMERPLHQLALIIGIVFAGLAPDLFTNKPDQVGREDMDTPEKTQKLLNTLPWVTRPKGGLKDAPILMSMMITYIIAFYDPRSPFRTYLKDSKILGHEWTHKHSKFKQMAIIRYSHLNVM